ncbi:hypothetical protein HAX54_051657 [Datura stramonium]|uniref:Uncharacterized protein n=1 Tax=Datura stramonium TaxID=4076 RepID=A0ABS8SYV7_DATST|nr:hypothetical protein [Datura stramonium]
MKFELTKILWGVKSCQNKKRNETKASKRYPSKMKMRDVKATKLSKGLDNGRIVCLLDGPHDQPSKVQPMIPETDLKETLNNNLKGPVN